MAALPRSSFSRLGRLALKVAAGGAEAKLPEGLLPVSSRLLHSSDHSLGPGGAAQPERQPKRRRFNVGALGAGRIASVHLSNVLSNRRLALRWVVDRDEQRGRQLMEQLHLEGDVDFPPAQQLAALLDDPELDGLLVLTSTASHAELVCEGLKRGKAVFCEKPVGESLADVKRCYEMSHKHGAPLLTGFMRRFDPVLQEVKHAMERGAVGTPHIIKLTSRDSPRPSYDFLKTTDSTGCNILSDMGLHDIDTLVWLTGAERPYSIYVTTHAHDTTMAESGVADTMATVIKFPSGKLACIDVVRDACYGYDVRAEVFGSEGRAVADSPRRSTATVDGRDGAWQPRMHYSFPQRFAQAFQLQMQHFADILDGKAEPLVRGEECILTAEIIEKGVQSARTGAAVLFD